MWTYYQAYKKNGKDNPQHINIGLANISKLFFMEIRSHLPQGTGSSALYWWEAKLKPYSESNWCGLSSIWLI